MKIFVSTSATLAKGVVLSLLKEQQKKQTISDVKPVDLMSKKLGINPKTGKPQSGYFLYEFISDGKKCYIGWIGGNGVKLFDSKIRSYGTGLTQTKIKSLLSRGVGAYIAERASAEKQADKDRKEMNSTLAANKARVAELEKLIGKPKLLAEYKELVRKI